MEAARLFSNGSCNHYFLVYPFFWRPAAEEETASRLRPIADLVRLLGNFVPNWAQSWVHRYAETPARFVFALALVVLFTWLGLYLAGKITDLMRLLWLKQGNGSDVPSGALYKLRTSFAYQATIRSIKYYIAPAFFALFFLYVGAVLTSHILFNFADAFGWTCTPTASSQLTYLKLNEPVTMDVETRSLCKATGYAVQIDPAKSNLYRIEVSTDSVWTHLNNQVSIRGFTIGTVENFWDIFGTALLTPLRRDWLRPWHRVLVRTGLTGTEEIYIDPDVNRDPSVASHSEADHIHNNGEIFLYINDAVIAVPWISDLFYRSNKGHVTVKMTLLK